jgi:sulfofructose kinase
MRDGAAVVFVGAATLDAVVAVAHHPAADERQVAEALEWAGGGPAATAAVACVRLGVPAAFVGNVGDDSEGARIRDGLAAEGVDVTWLCRVPGRRSGASVVIVDAVGGTRAICTRPVPPLEVPPGTLAEIASAAWVHADHLGWDVVRRWARAAGCERPRLSVDAGNAIPGLRRDHVDLYVPTVEQLRLQYGDGPVERLLEAALADGARTVVTTAGAQGSAGAERGGERAVVPALPVRAISTLGAGDVFHGALVAATVRGYGLSRCLAYANAAAGLSCRALDGRSAIPTHEETIAAMDAAPELAAAARAANT